MKKNDRQPVIQIHFSFLSTENDLPKWTILNATDVWTGYAMVVVLQWWLCCLRKVALRNML